MNTHNTITDNYRNRVFGKENRFYLMGLSIIWIVLMHFYSWFQGKLPWWIYFFNEGQTGVDILFFLSAYGLEASLRKNSWSSFYRNRIKRIIPVYMLFLIFLFSLFYNNIRLEDILRQCFAQLTGLSLFKEDSYFSTNFLFDWFTPALIIYYLLFPFISYGLNMLLHKYSSVEIPLFISIIIFCIFAIRFVHFPIIALIYRIPIIYLGAVTYIHIKNKNINRIFLLYIISFIGGLLSNKVYFLTSVIMPSFLFVFSLVQIKYPFFKTISYIGHHSYEIYLAHLFPVTNFFMQYIFKDIFVYILVTIVWTIFFATLFSILPKHLFNLFIHRKI